MMGAAPLCAAPCAGVLGAAEAALLDGLEEEEGRAEERPAAGGYALGGAALASSLPRPEPDVGRSSPLRVVLVVSTSNTFWKLCDGTASTLRRSFSGRCESYGQWACVSCRAGRTLHTLHNMGTLTAPAERRVWERVPTRKKVRTIERISKPPPTTRDLTQMPVCVSVPGGVWRTRGGGGWW